LLATILMMLTPTAASAAEPVPSVPPSSTQPSPPPPSSPPSKLHWDEDRPRFRPVEYVVTGVVGPAAIVEYTLLRAQGTPHWTAGNAFDDGIRDALRLRSSSALAVAWSAADIVGVSVTVLAVGVDSFLVPMFRGSPDVAVQLTLMSLESYALSSILSITLYDTVGRARPSYSDCQKNPSANADCSISPTASFPSGHTNEAFTAAGLSCAHHANVPIYGSRLADTLACVRDLTLATSDGVLRIMGDRHYTTDVLTGAAIGFGFGFGLPTLLHYRTGAGADRSALGRLSVSPMLGAGTMGLVAAGPF
jgi:membrane-associated phospholipid phosphatase